MNYSLDTFRTEHWGEHANAVAVGSWYLVVGEWFGLGTHHNGSRIGCYFNDPVYSPRQIFGLRLILAAGFRNVFISDAVIIQQFRQNQPIELRPT